MKEDYPFKWVCEACHAIYLKERKICRRCGSTRLERRTASSKLAILEAYKNSFCPNSVPRDDKKPKQDATDLDDMINDILGD